MNLMMNKSLISQLTLICTLMSLTCAWMDENLGISSRYTLPLNDLYAA